MASSVEGKLPSGQPARRRLYIYKLPASAGATSAGTAAAKPTESSAPASEASAAAVSAPTPSSSEQQHPEEDLAQRSKKDNQENYAKNEDLLSRQLARFGPGLRHRKLRPGSCQLYARVLCDDIRHPGRHQCYRAAVVILSEQRDGLAAKASDFSIGQNRLQSVADFDAVFSVLHGQKDEDAVVRGFAADAPLLVQVDRVALNVRPIQGVHRDYGNLRMRLLVELLADVIELRDGVLIENVGKVVDVIGGVQLGDRFCPKQQRERQQGDGDADRLQELHPRVIV
jgi:hypothetical protein